MNDEERRLANSTMISQTSLALMVTSIPYIMFALEKRVLEPLFVGAVAIGILLLVVSNVLGGRGINKINAPGDLFDWQAKLCLIGFLVLYLGSFIFLGAPLSSSTDIQLTQAMEKIGQLNERIEANGKADAAQQAQIEQDLEKISRAIRSLEELHQKEAAPSHSECE